MKFHGKPPSPKGEPLTPALRKRLEAFVAEHGEAQVAQQIGLATSTLARALAGLPVYRGTVRIIETAFEQQGVKA
jgi:hypothetical protein